jgi:hypothetical protein
MKLKNKLILILFSLLFGFQGGALFAQSLADSLSKKIAELEKGSQRVFQEKIRDSRCLNVTQSNNTYNITYRDKSGCKDYERGDYYIGTLNTDGETFNTGVYFERPADPGNKINSIYIGGQNIGYVVYDFDFSCLFTYSENAGNNRVEFVYDIKNCGVKRKDQNIRIYSREIENGDVENNWAMDTISSNLKNINDRKQYASDEIMFQDWKRVALDFIYSAEITRQIPKKILIDSKIFSEQTYQTFRANLKNFLEKNSLRKDQLSFYSKIQNWSPEPEENKKSGSSGSSASTSTSSQSEEEGLGVFAIFGGIIGLVALLIFLGSRKKRKEDAEAKEKERLLKEKEAREAEEKRRLAEEKKRLAEEEKRRLAEEKELAEKKKREELTESLKKLIDKDISELQEGFSELLESNLKKFEEISKIVAEEEENLKRLKENHPDIAKIVKTRKVGDASGGIVKKIKELIKDL